MQYGFLCALLIFIIGCSSTKETQCDSSQIYDSEIGACCVDNNQDGMCDGKEEAEQEVYVEPPLDVDNRDCCIMEDGQKLCDNAASPRDGVVSGGAYYEYLPDKCCLDENGNKICDANEVTELCTKNPNYGICYNTGWVG